MELIRGFCFPSFVTFVIRGFLFCAAFVLSYDGQENSDS